MIRSRTHEVRHSVGSVLNNVGTLLFLFRAKCYLGKEIVLKYETIPLLHISVEQS